MNLVTAGVILAGGPALAAPRHDSLPAPGATCGINEPAPAGLRLRPAGKAPLTEEATGGLMKAFYTCSDARPVALRVGRGWLAIGPVRRA